MDIVTTNFTPVLLQWAKAARIHRLWVSCCVRGKSIHYDVMVSSISNYIWLVMGRMPIQQQQHWPFRSGVYNDLSLRELSVCCLYPLSRNTYLELLLQWVVTESFEVKNHHQRYSLTSTIGTCKYGCCDLFPDVRDWTFLDVTTLSCKSDQACAQDHVCPTHLSKVFCKRFTVGTVSTNTGVCITLMEGHQEVTLESFKPHIAHMFLDCHFFYHLQYLHSSLAVTHLRTIYYKQS